MIRFLAHFFTSNTRHGTHSPFVYALADRVIYNKQYQKAVGNTTEFGIYSGQYNRLLKAVLRFLDVEHILFDGYSSQGSAHTAVLKSVENVDEIDVANLSKHKVLVVLDLYKNRASMRQWNWIKSNSFVHVTIDLYYVGFVFHRPQQRKENFKLKYPFWI